MKVKQFTYNSVAYDPKKTMLHRLQAEAELEKTNHLALCWH